MTAIPDEVLGLKVEVVRSIRRTAALHIVGSNLQVRVPKDLVAEGTDRFMDLAKVRFQ